MTGLSSLPSWAILTIILLLTSVLNEVEICLDMNICRYVHSDHFN